ncbi:MAG: YraN family protein [Dehalococcoidia bacterium]|nr:MAG: YraN family protein [Dehalococcoidia bacterium]
MKTRATGQLGEKLAQNFLKKRGYRIVETNYRSRDGEVDIIVSKDGILVFVEVRAKSSRTFGTPEESITRRKKQKLILVAQDYVQTHGMQESPWRIDFVAVELDNTGKAVRIEQFEDAVGEE